MQVFQGAVGLHHALRRAGCSPGELMAVVASSGRSGPHELRFDIFGTPEHRLRRRPVEQIGRDPPVSIRPAMASSTKRAAGSMYSVIAQLGIAITGSSATQVCRRRSRRGSRSNARSNLLQPTHTRACGVGSSALRKAATRKVSAASSANVTRRSAATTAMAFGVRAAARKKNSIGCIKRRPGS